MIKVGLAGGRGYVGEEILTLLAKIPEYQVVYVGSRSSAGKPVGDEYSGLNIDLDFQDLSPDSIRTCATDVWVIAQPNGQAAEFVKMLEGSSAKIIDISSDFRFDNHWTYGLPERNEGAIKASSRIANPGCYATATQLALLPISGELGGIPHAFGVSGFSGAGRTPSEKNDPARLANNLLPYSLAGHTHEKEVSRHLGRPIRFMPHVAAFFRGISMTVNVELKKSVDATTLRTLFKKFYQQHPLVEVVNGIPEIQQVSETNRAMIGGFVVDQCFLNPLGKQANLSSAVDRTHVDISLADQRDNLGCQTFSRQQLSDMLGLPHRQGTLPRRYAKRLGDVGRVRR